MNEKNPNQFSTKLSENEAGINFVNAVNTTETLCNDFLNSEIEREIQTVEANIISEDEEEETHCANRTGNMQYQSDYNQRESGQQILDREDDNDNVEDDEESDFEGFERNVIADSAHTMIDESQRHEQNRRHTQQYGSSAGDNKDESQPLRGDGQSEMTSAGGGIISDIFAESDGEEFEGFAENEIYKPLTSSFPNQSAGSSQHTQQQQQQTGASSRPIKKQRRNKLAKSSSNVPENDSSSSGSSSSELDDDNEFLRNAHKKMKAEKAANKSSGAGNKRKTGDDGAIYVNDDNDDDAAASKSKKQFIETPIAALNRILERDREERRAKRLKTSLVSGGSGKDSSSRGGGGSIEQLNDLEKRLSALVSRMKLAALDDEEANLRREPALSKLRLLPEVRAVLNKSMATKSVMLECTAMLSMMTLWLRPLPGPGQPLPNQTIRTTLLTALLEFPPLTPALLSESGIGKAVMFLKLHPRELPTNKQMCTRLINDWSRLIFRNSLDMRSSLTREQRKRMDAETLQKRRVADAQNNIGVSSSFGGGGGGGISSSGVGGLAGSYSGADGGGARPGDAEFVPRARVPRPSNKDYIVRPRSKVDASGNLLPEETERAKRKRMSIAVGSAEDEGDLDEEEEEDEANPEISIDISENAELRRKRGGRAAANNAKGGPDNLFDRQVRRLRDNLRKQRNSFPRPKELSITGRNLF